MLNALLVAALVVLGLWVVEAVVFCAAYWFGRNASGSRGRSSARLG